MALAKKIAQRKKDYASLKFEDLLSVVCYTGSMYKPLNSSLYKDDYKYPSFTYHLIRGLRSLPYFWGVSWRGRPRRDEDKNLYVPGKCISWDAFSSSSKLEIVGNQFAAKSTPAQTIFKICSLSGRDIEELSHYPDEHEILLPAFTAFKVVSTKEEKNVLLIELKEVQFWFGDRIALWVDDNPQYNKALMERAEKNSVCILMKKSTEEALTFLQGEYDRHLLGLPLSKFRILTDMARKEGDKLQVRAGLNLIEQLRKLGYNNKIMVYSSSKRLDENKAAVKNCGAVTVTSSASDANAFCCFETVE